MSDDLISDIDRLQQELARTQRVLAAVMEYLERRFDVMWTEDLRKFRADNTPQ